MFALSTVVISELSEICSSVNSLYVVDFISFAASQSL